MPHPIKTCLTAGEWVEERRGEASARRSRRKAETKTIATFISQGAAGGAVGYFLAVAYVAIIHPTVWLFAYCLLLPLLLAFGAVLGALPGLLVWLVALLFKRRPNFFARSVVVTGYLVFWGFALSYATRESTDPWPMSSMVVSLGLMKLPIVLMTGSSIRPCRVLLLGAGRPQTCHNFGSWLSLPAGFLLRVATTLLLLEALMIMALCLSNQRVGRIEFPTGEHLPAIGLAVLYFAAAWYVSIWTPRKVFLLPAASLLCGPLVSLVVYAGRFDPPTEQYLLPPLLTLISLWAIYTLGRLLAPESPRRLLVDSWREAVAPQIGAPRGACQVQP